MFDDIDSYAPPPKDWKEYEHYNGQAFRIGTPEYYMIKALKVGEKTMERLKTND